MSQPTPSGGAYFCPMQTDVRQPLPGKCPKCGMELVPQGTRFALFRHMASNPLHLVLMGVLMVALMAGVMLMLH